ncbi:MAG: ABC transporter permease [Candidatus Acidiferrales bacterium]
MPNWKPEILRRLTPLKLSPTREAEIAEEIAQHLEDRYEEFLVTGQSEDAAYRTALDELKDEDLLARSLQRVEKNFYREPIAPGSEAGNFFAGVLQDLHYALRMLRKYPGFTAVAVLSLAVGLAANTAIFSVINGVLLQPLEYPNPGQLVDLQLFVPDWAHKFPMVPLNPATYLAWSRQAKSLAGIAVADQGNVMNLTGAGEPALLNADAVSPTLFDVLGVKPLLGRNFSPDADQAGRNHEVILTYHLWRNRFHSDTNIIGHALALDGSPYTVVGILPASFDFPTQNELNPIAGPTPPAELFVPRVFDKDELQVDSGFGLATIARLKSGVSSAQAAAELNVILSQQFHAVESMSRPQTIMMPLRDVVVRSTKRGLWMLLAAVLAVLLIICLNLANLVLMRATAREHEAAIRTALGASRGRLLRQTLTETLLLGLLGGTLGLVLAYWALWGLLALAPVTLPRINNVHLDGAVLGFTLGISILAGVLAGLLPAWRASQANPQDALRSGGARNADSNTRLRAREFLVGLETAFSVMLLVAAGLLVASFAKLVRVPEGFAVDHILTVNLQLPEAQYTQTQQRGEFWQKALAATSALPGVESSAVTNFLPLYGEINDDPVDLPGDTRPEAERPYASYRHVSPAYFKTLGIPLLNGRELTWADAGTNRVVISADAAKAFWPGFNPIGQRFDVDPSSKFPGFQVVGVVGDTRSIDILQAPTPMIYGLEESGLIASLILRTRLPATAVAAELHSAIWKIDSSVAIPSILSMGQIVSASLAPRRFETLLTSLFAAAALLLACLGIYGMVSYSVVRRTHEIGIRMALGAQKADVLRQVIGQGMKPTVFGLVAGIVGALGFTRFLSSLLFGVKPFDPLTFILVSLILGAVALAACYIPARRATRVDPMIALRYE